MPTPRVSVVVTCRDDAQALESTLDHIATLDTTYAFEVIAVDGGSAAVRDVARDWSLTRRAGGDGRGADRNRGARAASGAWLAFIDAGVEVHPGWLDELMGLATRHDLVATSSRCRLGGWAATVHQALVNHVYPRLYPPILPGFNLLVQRGAFEASGGFRPTGDGAVAFSRRIGRHRPTGTHPDVLATVPAAPGRWGGLLGAAERYLPVSPAPSRP